MNGAKFSGSALTCRSRCGPLRSASGTDLSLLVTDRGVLAAEAADDPVRMAAAKWNLGHILLAQGETDGAEEAAMKAIEDLRHPGTRGGPRKAPASGNSRGGWVTEARARRLFTSTSPVNLTRKSRRYGQAVRRRQED
jgi:hypothetical protein